MIGLKPMSGHGTDRAGDLQWIRRAQPVGDENFLRIKINADIRRADVFAEAALDAGFTQRQDEIREFNVRFKAARGLAAKCKIRQRHATVDAEAIPVRSVTLHFDIDLWWFGEVS